MAAFRRHRRIAAGPLAGVLAMLVVAVMPASATAAARDANDAATGFGVAPLRIDVSTGAGQTSTHQVTIRNTGSSATTFSITREDFQGSKDEPDATPVLLGGKLASDISGYDWLSAPDTVTVPPGQSRTFTAKVSVPSGAVGGHYAALVVSGVTRKAGDLQAQSRVAVLFLMNAGGAPPPDIVINEVREVGPTTTVTEYINKGTTHVEPNGDIIVRDPVTNKIIKRIPGTCTTALPGSSGTCTFDEEAATDADGRTVGSGADGEGGVKSGLEKRYVSIGEPGGDRARAELPTEWSGAAASLLLPLLGIAGLVSYFWFLRRRRAPRVDDLGLDDLA